MRISNKVKRLMNLMKMLPNYTFSKAIQGVIHSYINVFTFDEYNNKVYIGEILLYFLPLTKSMPETHILFGMPIEYDFQFAQEILNKWASIGIQHRPCGNRLRDAVFIYYELWIEDAE